MKHIDNIIEAICQLLTIAVIVIFLTPFGWVFLFGIALIAMMGK